MKRIFVLGAAIVAVVASPANAGEFLVDVGAPLQFPDGGGTDDRPVFRVVNTTPGSATSPFITSLLLALDSSTPATITAVNNAVGFGDFPPGTDNGTPVGNPTVSFITNKLVSLTYGVSRFDPGAYSSFRVNFGPGVTDFRTALFNGSNTLTAMFSDNSTAQVTFIGSPTSNADTFGFSSTAVAAVPEPATWAMMLLGFGVIGGSMRRRGLTGVQRRTAFG
ncbi:PEPxxWA-CTERM sorting domain-containing protein [Sphingomonas sp. M1-B02]|uniref:PEPxxWA-CTERM sorting domain-containing protein n=1 Tax=Sphingomonas sp. M1-B02 TaxID=3114300 RepID=UPI0022402C03|nr:PEPxxWA-CTERM sorting domain-containing protein [Sphingomonas sp. S6-11]UZK67710.1 PEPxxWA-CTERM sorting domain-containing protein [Sphingomonas sp. S6-11]